MKLLKRFLVCFVAAFAMLLTIASCDQVEAGPTAEAAAKRIVLVQDKQTVSDSFQVPATVILEGVTFSVAWASDNPVATIEDLDENYKKVVIDYKNNKDAEQTVVLSAIVSNGENSFEKRFTFKVPQYEETGLLKNSIRTPEFGIEYLLGLPQTAKNEVYYFTGAMSGYYGATETNSNLGILVKLEETTGGFYVTFEVNGKKNYINGVKSGSYLNFVFSETASNVWEWNAEHCTAVTSIEGTQVFMGTSDNYVTFGMMKVEELGKSTVYAGTLYKKPADYNYGNNDAPTTPTLVKNPEVNVEYLLGLDQTVKSAQYFFTGAMSGYYGATETDFGKGIAVKLVEATNGYYITFQSGGKTQYINGVKSGTHLNFVFGDTASSVWKWNAEHSTFTTFIEDKEVFMGTNDGYVTFGMLTTDKLGKEKIYPGHLYTKPAASSQGGSSNVQIDTNKVYTVAELLALGGKLKDGEVTTVRAKVKATVESITDYTYGGMKLTDETGTISVYGSYSADGTLRYGEMTEAPLANYEVVLSCILKNFKGTVEINSAWILEFEELESNFNEADYTSMTIAEAREKAVNSKVKLTGVVAKITYANGKKPSGFYLVDGTNSIYVYDNQLAPRVKEGDRVTVCATRVNWILEKEQASASKFGYEGCIQVEKAYLIGEIEKNQEIDLSWVTEKTVKEIMDTPVSNNITTTIYKVNAYVKKVIGTGFVNYYIEDIDGVTGSYTYTQCNGGDFDWLDEFDGKICTVYLSVINAKSESAGCVWRFLPIKVTYDNYSFNLEDAAQYAITYHAKDQFLPEYTGNPEKELLTSVSNLDLGIENVALSYSSSDNEVVYFTTVNGKTILNVDKVGQAVVTITATYNSKTVTETITITVKENPAANALTVEEAIAAELDETITIKGIVGPSLVNKDGFYLMGDTAIIGVLVNSKDIMETIEIGQYVVVEGTRKHYTGSSGAHGQTLISGAKVIANFYGNTNYTTTFEEKTLQQIIDLDPKVDLTTKVFKVTCSYNIYGTGYSTQPQLIDENGKYFSFYCSGAGQYGWLTDVMKNEDGTYKTATFEVALCNWNNKSFYRGCVLSVTLEDGTKVYNNLNFN